MIQKSPKVFPPKLIRFYGNIEHALECLEENLLVAPNVLNFNDPFDPCSFLIINGELPLNIEEADAVFSQNIHGDTFISCFSAINLLKSGKSTALLQNELYMWSHYANAHKGIAIEFDTKSLENAFIELNGDFKLQKITYEDFLPMETKWLEKPRHYEKEIKFVFAENLFRKNKLWRYENEWRICFGNKDTRQNIHKERFENKTISRIYLGWKCSEENKKRIISAAQTFQENAEIITVRRVNGAAMLSYLKT